MRTNTTIDIKAALVGLEKAGKTALANAWLGFKYEEDIPKTIAANFMVTKLADERKIGVWDTGGSELYQSMTRHYLKGTDILVCVFGADLKYAEQIGRMETSIADAKNADKPNMAIYCVLTKTDLPAAEQITTSAQVTEFANTHNAKVFLCSAKTGSPQVKEQLNAATQTDCPIPKQAADAKEVVKKSLLPCSLEELKKMHADQLQSEKGEAAKSKLSWFLSRAINTSTTAATFESEATVIDYMTKNPKSRLTKIVNDLRKPAAGGAGASADTKDTTAAASTGPRPGGDNSDAV